MTEPVIGLHPGLARVDYNAIEAINVSTLSQFERTASHAREAKLRPKKPTEAMDFGTAFHCAILEPQKFADTYVAAPKVDRRFKKDKEIWAKFEAEHHDSEIITVDEFNAIQRMKESIWRHPIASGLLRDEGLNEVGVVFQERETGVMCKGLIDRLSSFDGWPWVMDLKTAEDAGKREFSRSARKLHYGARAAFYRDGCYAIAPHDRKFAWIVIESARPHAINVFEADESALKAGRSKYMRWLRLYEEAARTNIWPGYPEEMQFLTAEDTEWYS